MSLESWKLQFYPKPPSKRMTKRQAIEHSLLKWAGLLPKNLEKHEVDLIGSWLSDSNQGISIESESCALCVKYYSRKWSASLQSCAACPLAVSLGNKCDGGGRNKPYGKFIENGDPRPMIRSLKKTLKALEDK